jgi:hypothetical protein
MTALRIDMKAFKEVCKAIRDEVKLGFNADDESILAFYRWFVQDAEGKFVVAKQPAAISAEDELRNILTIAARNRQQFGATKAQIEMLISLAAKNGYRGFEGTNVLTKSEASGIITFMKGA